MSDKILNFIIYGIIRFALLIPYRMRLRLFGGFVAYVVAPLAGYHTRSVTHLKRACPDMPKKQRQKIARAASNNFGRTMIENYSGAQLQGIAEQAKISGPGFEALELAKAEGRPVVFVSGHFGNFEVPRRALTHRGYTIGGIYREMSNSHFNKHYEQTMMDVSGPVFAQGSKGVLQFVRFLKKGGMGTILIDVRNGRFPDIDFFGHPAPTSSAAADFALRLDALLVPYFGRRHADGVNFDVFIGEPIPANTPTEMIQNATDQLAQMVRDNPEQYFWVHRRWRV